MAVRLLRECRRVDGAAVAPTGLVMHAGGRARSPSHERRLGVTADMVRKENGVSAPFEAGELWECEMDAEAVYVPTLNPLTPRVAAYENWLQHLLLREELRNCDRLRLRIAKNLRVYTGGTLVVGCDHAFRMLRVLEEVCKVLELNAERRVSDFCHDLTDLCRAAADSNSCALLFEE